MVRIFPFPFMAEGDSSRPRTKSKGELQGWHLAFYLIIERLQLVRVLWKLHMETSHGVLENTAIILAVTFEKKHK